MLSILGIILEKEEKLLPEDIDRLEKDTESGKIKEYALDDDELEAKQKQLLRKGVKKENIKIQRFKGLGEMNPSQLRETTLAPESRRLMQLTLTTDADENTFALLDMLLSKKRAGDRRQWLEENGDKAEMID